MEENKSKPFLKRYPTEAIVTWLFCGYICGFAGILLCFIYLLPRYLYIEFNVAKCVVISAFISFILLLCYNRHVRCVITLAIPILCSSKGRSLVIAFAFFLVAIGPTRNILRNIEVLADSLTCGQMRLKQALGDMLDVVKQPLVAIKDMIFKAMEEIRKVMHQVERLLYQIQELVLVLVAGIRNAFDWLESIVSVCNKEFGTPFDRCRRLADEAMESCRAKMGFFSALCNVTHVFALLCYTVKFIDVICVMVVYFNYAVVDEIMESLRLFKEQLKILFDVEITFDHDFYFKTVASQDLRDVTRNIMADIHSKVGGIIVMFGYLDFVCSLLLLLVIIKAIWFKAKYLRNAAYQNVYITKDFLEINETRRRNGQELVLPLKRTERRKYLMLNSWRFTRSECFAVLRNSLFLTISCAHLGCICFADYSLYWLLAVITRVGYEQAGLEVPPAVSVDVEGDGIVADIVRGIVHAFEPLTVSHSYDAHSCLPHPHTPNFWRYYQIAALSLFAWVLLFCQPHGLRLRHVVMRIYYPEEARSRAGWLYNRILAKRMSFFKFARRKVRAKFTYDKTVDNYTCLDWLRAKYSRFRLCRCLLGDGKRSKACLICSTPVTDENQRACAKIGCSGLYCQTCYEASNNSCCICRNPIDYGDLTDISEEKGSPDESDQEPNEVRVVTDDTEDYCSTRPTSSDSKPTPATTATLPTTIAPSGN